MMAALLENRLNRSEKLTLTRATIYQQLTPWPKSAYVGFPFCCYSDPFFSETSFVFLGEGACARERQSLLATGCVCGRKKLAASAADDVR